MALGKLESLEAGVGILEVGQVLARVHFGRGQIERDFPDSLRKGGDVADDHFMKRQPVRAFVLFLRLNESDIDVDGRAGVFELALDPDRVAGERGFGLEGDGGRGVDAGVDLGFVLLKLALGGAAAAAADDFFIAVDDDRRRAVDAVVFLAQLGGRVHHGIGSGDGQVIFEDGQILGGISLEEAVKAEVGRDAGGALRAGEDLGQHDLAFPVGGRLERLGMVGQGFKLGFEGGFEAVLLAVDLGVEGLGLDGGVLVILRGRG